MLTLSTPYLYLISHTEYSLKVKDPEFHRPFGEINNAKKLHTILKQNEFPVSDIFDFYELFGIDNIKSADGELLFDMYDINSSLISADQEMITDFNNKITNTFRSNLKEIVKHEHAVILLLTWGINIVATLSTGVQNDYPLIAKEDSYGPSLTFSHLFPNHQFAKQLNLVLSESILGALNLYKSGVFPSHFLFFPNLAPEDDLRISKLKKEEGKRKYLETLFTENQKKGFLPDNPLIIGCPSRFTRRKNVEFLLYVMHDIHKKFPNVFLVLKGWFDPGCDQLSLYSEKLYQLIESAKEQPWFLLDQTQSPYPEVLQIYSYFDIGAMISGAELGCNTVPEMCAMGVPLLLLNATVNPYLYQNMAFMPSTRKKVSKAPWVFSQPDLEDLKIKLENLITSTDERERLGKQARELAKRRFGAHQLIKRTPLMVKSAWNFFHQTDQVKECERILYNQLMEDLQEFHSQGDPQPW